MVTGVSPQSVGEGTAHAFASQQPAVLILASRTQAKLETVATAIRGRYPAVRVETVLVDLSSQESIRAAAAQIFRLIDRLDILVNNAGVFTQVRRWTVEKIEQQFGTNHVGPFLLTNLLMPLLLKSAETAPKGATRIVNVSSAGHRISPVRFRDYNFEGNEVAEEERPVAGLQGAFARVLPDGYPPIIAYAQSKTANVLFTVSLRQRLYRHGIASYVLHPGGKSLISHGLSGDPGRMSGDPGDFEWRSGDADRSYQVSKHAWAGSKTTRPRPLLRGPLRTGRRRTKAPPPPWLPPSTPLSMVRLPNLDRA